MVTLVPGAGAGTSSNSTVVRAAMSEIGSGTGVAKVATAAETIRTRRLESFMVIVAWML